MLVCAKFDSGSTNTLGYGSSGTVAVVGGREAQLLLLKERIYGSRNGRKEGDRETVLFCTSWDYHSTVVFI